MFQLIAKIVVTGIGLWVADRLLDGVQVESVTTLVVAAIVLGIVNTLVRPLVVILTLPITFLTFGIFLLIINGAMLLLTARIVASFHIESFGAAILTWLIVSIVNWVLPTGGGEEKKGTNAST